MYKIMKRSIFWKVFELPELLIEEFRAKGMSIVERQSDVMPYYQVNDDLLISLNNVIRNAQKGKDWWHWVVHEFWEIFKKCGIKWIRNIKIINQPSKLLNPLSLFYFHNSKIFWYLCLYTTLTSVTVLLKTLLFCSATWKLECCPRIR